MKRIAKCKMQISKCKSQNSKVKKAFSSGGQEQVNNEGPGLQVFPPFLLFTFAF
jgi:hypothetical protein